MDSYQTGTFFFKNRRGRATNDRQVILSKMSIVLKVYIYPQPFFLPLNGFELTPSPFQGE